MDKDWKLITRVAVFGLVVTGLIAAYINFSGIFDADLYTAFVILCPPVLLSIPFGEVMKDKGVAYVIWPLIGLLNSGLYAVVGAAVVGLRKKSR